MVDATALVNGVILLSLLMKMFFKKVAANG